MLGKILLLSLVICSALAFEPGHTKESYIFAKFQEFLAAENKSYPTVEEYMTRFNVFQSNYMKMEAMTLSPDSVAKTYNVGINKFADMTTQEFRRSYLNLNVNVLNVLKAKSQRLTFTENSAPAAFDWRAQGAVGPVKDQGSCGSCWAFSTVGNLEGLNFIKNGKMVQFSEQQLVDCDKVDSACNGGLMENAFNYLQQAGGIQTQADYPYRATKNTCRFDRTKSALQVKGFNFAASQDEEEIKQFLHTTGPLAVALNADPLQFYRGGVINDDATDCDPQGLNHGVTIVGYGTEDNQDYWIVKNSWGPRWGEEGYFRMARGNGTCGINTYVVSADLQ